MTEKQKPLFERLKESLEQGIRHARGEIELKTYVLTAPDRPPVMDSTAVVALRNRLRTSRAEFAMLVNVPVRTIELWEQGKSKPSGAAARLLQIYAARPDVIEFLNNGRNGSPSKSKKRAPVRTKG